MINTLSWGAGGIFIERKRLKWEGKERCWEKNGKGKQRLFFFRKQRRVKKKQRKTINLKAKT